MAPIIPDQYRFRFHPRSLRQLRNELSLSQADIAALLDVPVNTVSRWETGNSTPDAHALAAIHSLSVERGVSPAFFVEASGDRKAGGSLIFAWDLQHTNMEERGISDEWETLRAYIDLVHPETKTSREYLAYWDMMGRFDSVEQERLGFTVKADSFNTEWALHQDLVPELGENPSSTTLYLAADWGSHENLLRESARLGVETYLVGTDSCTDQLKSLVDASHFVHLDRAWTIVRCIEIVEATKGLPIDRRSLGQQFKGKMDEYELEPSELGFGSRNPYAGILRWMEVHGLIAIEPSKGNKIVVRSSRTKNKKQKRKKK